MIALRRFWADEFGATSIEYGVIGALLSILCYAGARAIGLSIDAKWLGPLSAAFN